jgi:hypothetical protein
MQFKTLTSDNHPFSGISMKLLCRGWNADPESPGGQQETASVAAEMLTGY